MRKVSSPAPKTPSKKSVAEAEAGEAGSPTKTPRKQHKCAHCGRPRQGHPRSGCPFADPPIPASPAASRVSEVEIIGELEKLQLTCNSNADRVEAVKAEDEKERRRRRSSTPRKIERAPSLASVSTTTSEALGKLAQSGSMAPMTDEETEQEDIKPGARSTPRKSGKKVPSRAPALKRTPTEDDLDAFLAELKDKSQVHPACGFLLTAGDLLALQPRFARVKGLEVRVLAAAGDPDAYVVVGRDKRAVDVLFARVRDEARKDAGGVRAMLGAGGVGAAAGAFAMFAGLAYA